VPRCAAASWLAWTQPCSLLPFLQVFTLLHRGASARLCACRRQPAVASPSTFLPTTVLARNDPRAAAAACCSMCLAHAPHLSTGARAPPPPPTPHHTPHTAHLCPCPSCTQPILPRMSPAPSSWCGPRLACHRRSTFVMAVQLPGLALWSPCFVPQFEFRSLSRMRLLPCRCVPQLKFLPSL
jgi:hypothetical protein